MSMQISSNQSNITCNGETNGIIQISVNGGNYPYTYNWSNSQNTPSLSGLSAGIYSVTVSDDINCSITQTYTISEPEKLVLDESHESVKCFGTETGSLTMTAIGGSAPYIYEVSNGTQSATGRIHNNLPAGAYSLIVTDDRGCEFQKDILISEPSELDAQYLSSNPTCRENNNGSVEIIASGGTAPYLFAWDNNVIDINTISGLEQGIYSISVIDANECTMVINSISLTDTPVDCIKIPNAFSPNADGINDTWIIDGREIFPDALISIYNRWGQMLYQARGDGEAWDGTYNDRFVPTGTYIYIMELNRKGKSYSGVVTVVY
jgi:gliding motility-associated-like protein